MFDLGNPQYMYLIVSPLLVWMTYMAYKSWRKKKQVEFADSVLFSQINPNQSQRKSVIKQILRFLGLSFLVIALVNPK